MPLVFAQTQPDKMSFMSDAKLVGAKEYTLTSRHTGKTYRVQVIATGAEPEGGYPVLYVLDGDALFPVAAMAAEGMVMRAMENNTVPMLIVGIGYPNGKLLNVAARAEDYTPPSENYQNTGDRRNKKFGGAERFYQFLQDELKTDIAKRFHVNQDWQSLFGHSYGGLFGLYTLFNHPNSFQNYLVASPSIWWNQQRIWQDWPKFLKNINQVKQTVGVRLTVGEYEEKIAPHLAQNQERQNILTRRGMIRETLLLERRLSELPEKKVDTEVRIYDAETHATSVLPALLDGLKWLYVRCHMQQQCSESMEK
ncbi:alpha/beta hydrolase [Neisseria montereyensis]|uniref:Alpha/beta hydrolase-fold protein n=1 Tax=Neisseria montereyensis TaxID=2973938 RepID=A0ABT2FB98_9NEIS|nr:alpha/beta hydrolase-fold protein [Neisseria montereyensis]MCS4533423.1 alpha/beta hydrolase-fold protein [Neisseria montereyensis]